MSGTRACCVPSLLPPYCMRCHWISASPWRLETVARCWQIHYPLSDPSPGCCPLTLLAPFFRTTHAISLFSSPSPPWTMIAAPPDVMTEQVHLFLSFFLSFFLSSPHFWLPCLSCSLQERTLVEEMGFPLERSRRALKRHNNNINRAVDSLFNGEDDVISQAKERRRKRK